MMGGLSILHWLILLTISMIWVVPSAVILRKAGFSGWLALIAFVPLVNLVALWVFAFVKWPVERSKSEQVL